MCRNKVAVPAIIVSLLLKFSHMQNRPHLILLNQQNNKIKTKYQNNKISFIPLGKCFSAAGEWRASVSSYTIIMLNKLGLKYKV